MRTRVTFCAADFPGRFHTDADAEPTSYLAGNPETTWKEVEAHAGATFNRALFRVWRITIPERTVQRLVDLRDPAERKRYRVSRAALRALEPPAKLKMLGSRLRREGKVGIIYDSVRDPGGVCIAVFLEHAERDLALESEG